MAFAAEFDLLTAYLHDGRVVSGTLHEQNDEYLWLKTITADTTLISRFARSSIHRTANGALTPLPTVPSEVVLHHTGELTLTGAANQRAQSLEIEATLANWDEDARADGLLVTILPIAADGSLVPLAGTVELSLVAEVLTSSRHTRGLKPGLRELEQSSHPVRNDDFSAGGATYRLPFDRTHPDLYPEIAAHGIVHVRLSATGNGVFEAADTHVRLRRFSPTSDHFQPIRHGRFVPGDPRNGR